MSNHTKGTWKCLGQMIVSEVIDSNGEERLVEIANLAWGHGKHGPQSSEEYRDNGFLIAAAPEMLEALKKIFFELNMDPEIRAKYKCLHKAAMAIAKAEGR